MLLRIPLVDAIKRLRAVRSGRRRLIRTHRSNVGELARLLAPAFRMRRKLAGVPSVPLALLRIQHTRGRGWHWAVWADGLVFDPLCDGPRALAEREKARTFYYELEARA
jgi:hypothetical protein